MYWSDVLDIVKFRIEVFRNMTEEKIADVGEKLGLAQNKPTYELSSKNNNAVNNAVPEHAVHRPTSHKSNGVVAPIVTGDTDNFFQEGLHADSGSRLQKLAGSIPAGGARGGTGGTTTARVANIAISPEFGIGVLTGGGNAAASGAGGQSVPPVVVNATEKHFAQQSAMNISGIHLSSYIIRIGNRECDESLRKEYP